MHRLCIAVLLVFIAACTEQENPLPLTPASPQVAEVVVHEISPETWLEQKGTRVSRGGDSQLALRLFPLSEELVSIPLPGVKIFAVVSFRR